MSEFTSTVTFKCAKIFEFQSHFSLKRRDFKTTTRRVCFSILTRRRQMWNGGNIRTKIAGREDNDAMKTSKN